MAEKAEQGEEGELTGATKAWYHECARACNKATRSPVVVAAGQVLPHLAYRDLSGAILLAGD